MNLDEIIKARRSVRAYLDKPIPADVLSAVLKAGKLAPSARNDQDWHFTVVQNKALRQELMAACKNQAMVGEAPASLVVWSTGRRTMLCGQSAATVDCSIALSFMMLKATELGLGSCWLGSFEADKVAELLILPQAATVVAVCPMGYPKETPAPTPRKPLGEISDIRE